MCFWDKPVAHAGGGGVGRGDAGCTADPEPDAKEVWHRGQVMLAFVGESGKPQFVHFIPRSLRLRRVV